MQTATLYQRIWEQVAAIPPGQIASYGQIARLAGAPGAARMVGRALGLAPNDLELPWHRVLNARGAIALPAGSDGWRRQCERLSDEGITVCNGRVDLHRYGWRPTLDELIWAPEFRGEFNRAAQPFGRSGIP